MCSTPLPLVSSRSARTCWTSLCVSSSLPAGVTIGIIVSSIVCPVAIIGIIVFGVCVKNPRARRRLHGPSPPNRPSPSPATGAGASALHREGGMAQTFHPPDAMGRLHLYPLYPPHQGVHPPSSPPVATAPFKGSNSVEVTPEVPPPPSYSVVMANTSAYVPEAEK